MKKVMRIMSVCLLAAVLAAGFIACGKTVSTEHVHEWGSVIYYWEPDYSSCRAMRMCEVDNTHEQRTSTKDIQKEVLSEPSCEGTGEIRYTAKFTQSWAGKTTKVVRTEALGHDWGDTVYEWTAANKVCTATRTCLRDPAHTETAAASVRPAEEKAPTCEGTGIKTFTATFAVPWAIEQKISVETDALGHDWVETSSRWKDVWENVSAEPGDDPSIRYEWVLVRKDEGASEVTCTAIMTPKGGGKTDYFDAHGMTVSAEELEDGSARIAFVADFGAVPGDKPEWCEELKPTADLVVSCTARRVCSRDPAHTRVSKATIAAESDADCTDPGKTEFVAEFPEEDDWAEVLSFSTKNDAALGHDFGADDAYELNEYEWNADHTKCVAYRRCRRTSCSYAKTATAKRENITVEYSANFCTAGGTITYTAVFPGENDGWADEAVEYVKVSPEDAWDHDWDPETNVCRRCGAVLDVSDGLIYYFRGADCVVTGWRRPDSFDETAGRIEVPAKAPREDSDRALPVAGVDVNAFKDRTELKEVSLPSGLTEIGEGAFSGCSSLERVNIPSNVTRVGAGAFSGTKWYENQPDGIVVLDGWILGFKGEAPSQITPENAQGARGVADGAFADCAELVSVVLPDSMRNVGAKAFSGCSGLKVLSVPEKASASADAFAGCSSLTDLTLPADMLEAAAGGDNAEYLRKTLERVSVNGGTAVPAGALRDFTALREVSLPAGLAEIGEDAFSGCSSLVEITIPAGLETMNRRVFYGCGALTVRCEDPGPAPEGWLSGWNLTGSGAYCPVIWDCGHNDTDENGYAYVVLNGLRYRLNPDNQTAGASVAPQPSDVVSADIPASIQYKNRSYAVREIAEAAFRNCRALESVSIPGSVKTVSKDAFRDCGSLSSVRMPDIAGWCGINFTDEYSNPLCNGSADLYAGNDTEPVSELAIDLGEVNNVGTYAFCGSRIESVSITGNLERINKGAFKNCAQLKTIKLPASVTYIADDAFAGCVAVTETELPTAATVAVRDGRASLKRLVLNAGKTIDTEAFAGCAALESVVFPDTLETIGIRAFKDCASLMTAEIPESVTKIETDAFSGCRCLTLCFAAAEESSQWKGCGTCPKVLGWPDNDVATDGYAYAVLNGMRYRIKDGAAEAAVQPAGLAGTKSVPAEITYKDVTCPVSGIVEGAFSGCTLLTDLEIGDNVEKIGRNAFSGCSKLKTVSFPVSVQEAGDGAFSGCTSLKHVVIDGEEGVAAWCGIEFGSNGSNPVEMAHGLHTAGPSGPSVITEITVPGTVETVRAAAFRGLTALTRLTIENGVKTVGREAFSGCSSLASVSVPETVTKVGEKAFYETKWFGDQPDGVLYMSGIVLGCKGTVSGNLTINGGTRVIADGACSGQGKIESLSLPDSLKHIGASAFKGCVKLSSVSIGAEVHVEPLDSSAGGSFAGCTGLVSASAPADVIGCLPPESLKEITITSGKIESSQFAAGFVNYNALEKLIVEEGVSKIGGEAFKGRSKLSSVSLPSTLETVGSGVFDGCAVKTASLPVNAVPSLAPYNKSTLQTVTLIRRDSATALPVNAFNGCSKLTLITLPDNLVSIGASAFEGCSALPGITLTDAPIESIGNNAFKGCSSLTTLTMPEAVTAVPDGMLEGCSRLETFSGYANVQTIGRNAFKGCSILSNVVVPEGVTSIGASAFEGCSSAAAPENAIPATLTSIGADAFKGCTALRNNYNAKVFVSDVSAWCGIEFGNEYANPGFVSGSLLINVDGADSSLTDLSADNISSVSEIRAYAFTGCGLENVCLPDSVSKIGTAAFKDCGSLRSLEIPAGISEIAADAFSGCNALYSAVLPHSALGAMPTTGESTDKKCPLKKVVFNDTDQITIGAEDLKYCKSLEEISIPHNAVLADGALSGITTLRKAAIPVSMVGKMPKVTASSGTTTKYTITNLVLNDVDSVEIPANAFDGYSDLQSITIPAAVSKMGEQAFRDCANLKTVVAADLGHWCSIDFANALSNPLSGGSVSLCTGDETHTVTRLEIPAGTEEIKQYAFTGCKSINAVLIPSTVTSVGTDAFKDCSNIQKVLVRGGDWLAHWCGITFANENSNPLWKSGMLYRTETVTGEDGYEHEDEQLIETLDVPSTISEIKPLAFYGAKCVKTVSVPSSLTKIGADAFKNCTQLNKVLLPEDAVSAWCGIDFGNAEANPLSRAKKLWLVSAAGTETEAESLSPESATEIKAYAFRNCQSLKSVSLPAACVKVGKEAFAGCANLKSFSAGAGIDEASDIESDAFTGCVLESASIPLCAAGALPRDATSGKATLKTLTLTDTDPITLTAENLAAFTGLTGIAVPANAVVEDGAFSALTALTKASIPVSAIGKMPRKTVTSGNTTEEQVTLTEVVLNDPVREGGVSIPENAFAGYKNLITITIPESITSIGAGAFADCGKLETVIIESLAAWCRLQFETGDSSPMLTAKNLKLATQDGSAPITDLVIPEDVTSVNDYAFRNCKSLTSVTIPNNVEGIGKSAFEGCVGLKTVRAGNGLTSVGAGAFKDCSPSVLKEVILTHAENGLAKWCGIAFADADANPLHCSAAVLYVGTVTETPQTVLTIPDTVSEIGAYAFCNCTQFTEIAVPPSVTKIGAGAFKDCTTTGAKVTLTDTENGLAKWCGIEFADEDANPLSRMRNLYIGNAVVENLDIPSIVGSVGKYAFLNCNLKSVSVPIYVSKIGEDAFRGCTGIDEVTINGLSEWCRVELGNEFSNPMRVMKSGGTLKGSGIETTVEPKTTTLTFPNGLRRIGDYAFAFADNAKFTLDSLNIPATVTYVGPNAFMNCVVISASLPACAMKSIPSYGDQDKLVLATILVPERKLGVPASAFRIPDYAFQNHKKLMHVWISSGITEIGAYAFADCVSLGKRYGFKIENQPGEERRGHFEWRRGGRGWSKNRPGNLYLAADDLDEEDPLFETHFPGGVIIPDTVTTIGEYAFSGCKDELCWVAIPDSVTHIGKGAFMNCSVLGAKWTKDTVLNTEKWALGKPVNIPIGADYVGEDAFRGCGWMKMNPGVFPEDAEYIGASAFEGTYWMEHEVENNSVAAFGGWAIKYKGEMPDNCVLSFGSDPGDIPDVYHIAPGAFSNKTSLVTVSMSEVRTIGDKAFFGCTGLSNVTIPASVTSIGKDAFSGCTNASLGTAVDGVWYLNDWAVGTRGEVPETVTLRAGTVGVADGAFAGLAALKHVVLAAETKYIGKEAFSGCTALETVSVKSGLLSVGKDAFKDCFTESAAANRKVTVENIDSWCGVDFGNEYANPLWNAGTLYAGEAEITELNLSGTEYAEGTVTKKEIKPYVFYGCTSVTSLTITEVSRIGLGAFANCTSLETLVLPDTLTGIAAISLTVMIDDMGANAFAGCDAVKTATIPAIAVRAVPKKSLEKVTIISGAEVMVTREDGTSFDKNKTIPGSMLYEDEFVLPEDLSMIPGSALTESGTRIPGAFEAFEGCDMTSLTSVTLPSGLDEIGADAFNGCSELVLVETPGNPFIPATVTSVGRHAFLGTKWYTEQAEGLVCLSGWILGYKGTLPDSSTVDITDKTPKGIADYAFENLTSMTAVTLEPEGEPYTQFYIGDGAFSGCSGLTAVRIPKFVKEISDFTFSNCTGLETVSGWNDTATIGKSAFEGCVSLTSVTLPAAVKKIREHAFYNCGALETVIVPDSIDSVGRDAFTGCNGIKYVTTPALALRSIPRQSLVRVTIRPGVQKIREGTDIDENKTIPVGAFAAAGKLIEVFFDGHDFITRIEDRAFKDCVVLASITEKDREGNTIPSGTTFVGDGAFSGCGALASLDIPDTVKHIGAAAFKNCASLTEALIPSLVTEINHDTWTGCVSLKRVSVPSSAAMTGPGGAFSGCTAIEEASVPVEFIREIPKDSLRKVTIVAEPSATDVRIPAGAFKDCRKLSEVIMDRVTAIGADAFEGCVSLAEITIGIPAEYVYAPDPLPFPRPGLFTKNEADAYVVFDRDLYVDGVDYKKAPNNPPEGTALFIKKPDDTYEPAPENPKPGTTLYIQVAVHVPAPDVMSAGTQLYVKNDHYESLAGQSIPAGTELFVKNADGTYSPIDKIYVRNLEDQYVEPVYPTAPDATFFILKDGNFEPAPTLYWKDIRFEAPPQLYVEAIGKFAFKGCSSLTIKCAVSKPESGEPAGWAPSWRNLDSAGTSKCPVIWGHDPEAATYPVPADDGFVYVVLDGIRYALENGNHTAEIVKQPSSAESFPEIPAKVKIFDSPAYPIASGTALLVKNADGTYSAAPTLYVETYEVASGEIASGTALFVKNADGTYSAAPDLFVKNADTEEYTAVTYPIASGTALFVKNGDGTYSAAPTLYVKTGTYGVATYPVAEGTELFVKNADGTYAVAPALYVEVPYTVAGIEENAFADTAWYASRPDGLVTLGKWVIGHKAVSEPPDKTVELPTEITGIADGAFRNRVWMDRVGVRSGDKIELPSTLKYIGAHAFAGCTSLTDVVIGMSVASVGEHAFEGCGALTVRCKADSVPANWNTTWRNLDNTNMCPMVLSCDTAETADDGAVYVVDDRGVRYALLQDADEGGNVVRTARVVKQPRNLENPSIGTSVNHRGYGYAIAGIDAHAFGGTKWLDGRPAGLAQTGGWVICWKGAMTSNTSIDTIEADTIGIADEALKNQTNITQLIIPESVKIFGDGWIDGCTGIKTAVIPADVIDAVPKNSLITVTVKKGETAVTIPANAFKDCATLKTVTVSDGIKDIGEKAFSGCTSLETVSLPADLNSVGDSAFSGCTKLGRIDLGDVATVSNNAFKDCTALKEIVIGNVDINIAADAFSGCSAVKTASVPAKVIASLDKTSLESITISGGAGGEIKENAFLDCTSLRSVIVLPGIETIGASAFSGCVHLESVTIAYDSDVPSTLKTIGASAFSGCAALPALDLPASVETIGASAFKDCGYLSGIEVPASVTSIAANTFEGCSSLTGITIPSGVSVNGNAFLGCWSLTIKCAVDKPESGEPAGWSASWRNLDSAGTSKCPVVWNSGDPASSGIADDGRLYVVEGGVRYALAASTAEVVRQPACLSGTEEGFGIPEKVSHGGSEYTVTGIVEDAFAGTKWYGTQQEGLLYLGGWSLGHKGDWEESSLTLREGITGIAAGAFRGCSSLTSVSIPSGTLYSAPDVFAGCTSIASATVPATVLGSVPKTALVTVTIDGGTDIPANAFADSPALKTVNIKDSVTGIGADAFKDCTALETLKIFDLGKWCGITFANENSNPMCNNTAEHAVSMYLNDLKITTRLELPSVTSVGDYAFINCSGLTAVIIPSGVTSVGDHAFSGCDAVEKVTMPVAAIGKISSADKLREVIINAGTAIPDNAFKNHAVLEAVSLPVSVTTIGTDAFAGCTSLKTATVPADLIDSIPHEHLETVSISGTQGRSVIGENAFNGLQSLTSVTVLPGVTVIGDGAFGGCENLDSFVIVDEEGNRSTLSSIGADAFKDCRSLWNVEIPQSVTAMSGTPFLGCECLVAMCKAGKRPDGWPENWNLLKTGDGQDEHVPVIWGWPAMATTEEGAGFIISDGIMYKIDAEDFSATVWMQPASLDAAKEIPGTVSNKDNVYTVTGVKERAFAKTAWYESQEEGLISMSGWVLGYKGTMPEHYGLEVESGKVGIADGAFRNQTNLESVIIPASVKHIGTGAFAGCSGIKSLTVSASMIGMVPTLSDKLETLVIDGDGAIPDGAFKNFTSLTSVTVQTGVTITGIGSEAFSGCTSLTDVSIPSDAITHIGENAFAGCDAWFNKDGIVTDNVAYLGTWAICLRPAPDTTVSELVLKSGTKGVADGAFKNNTTLTSVTVPSTVETIGESAFSGCSAIANANLPAGLINKVIADSRSVLENLTINSGTAIPDDAFGDCEKLTSIEIPASVKSVGANAFSGCALLETVTFAEGSALTSIGAGAFSGCSKLTAITIPSGVKAIADNTFDGCTNLASVAIHAQVTSVGTDAFKGCTGIKNATLPAGLITAVLSNSKTKLETVTLNAGPAIPAAAFKDCTALTSVTVQTGAQIKDIGSEAFSGCSVLETVTIPSDAITHIGENAFAGTAWLSKDENAADNVVYLGSWAICLKPAGEGSAPVTSISLKGGTRGIADGAFKNNTDIASVTVPKEMKYVGTDAFSGCSALAKTIISSEGGVEAWCGIVFGNPAANPLYVAKNLYLSSDTDNAVKTITIPGAAKEGGGKEIKAYTFYNCTSLEDVTIASEVTEVGTDAFKGCVFTKVTMRYALWDDMPCTGTGSDKTYTPETVVLSDTASVTIGSGAFAGYANLKEIVIPASATVESGAFPGITGLEKATVPISAVPNMPRVTEGEQSTYTVKTLILNSGTEIPDEAFADYANLKEITVPSTVESIGESAFNGCSALETVTFADGSALTSIGWRAFGGCSALTSFAIPASVTSIGVAAFSGCTALTAITIPSGVTEIPDAALEGCTSLTSVTVQTGATITGIGSEAFSGCSALTDVTIPDSAITHIGENAFNGCDAWLDKTENGPVVDNVAYLGSWAICLKPDATVSELVLKSGTKGIADGAFRGNTDIASLKLPGEMKYVGANAFNGCSKLCSVIFAGKMNKWLSVNRGQTWNASVPADFVECEDGYAAIAGTGGSGSDEYQHKYTDSTMISGGTPYENGTFEFSAFNQSLTSKKEVAIKREDGEYTTTTIGKCSGSAMSKPKFETVFIPDSITTIEKDAFNENVKTICFLGSMEQWNSISKGTEGTTDWWQGEAGQTLTVHCADGVLNVTPSTTAPPAP